MESVRADACTEIKKAPDREGAITALALASRRGMPSGLSRRVFVKIGGQTHDLWRAVDHEGEALEAMVTKRRDKQAFKSTQRLVSSVASYDARSSADLFSRVLADGLAS